MLRGMDFMRMCGALSAVLTVVGVLGCARGSSEEPNVEVRPERVDPSTPAEPGPVPEAASPPELPPPDAPVANVPAPPSEVPPPSGPPPASTPPAQPGVAASCDSLTRTACMESTTCTLEQAGDPKRRDLYRCRPAQGSCEGGVAQSAFSGETRDEARQACEARSGCALDLGMCYCACRGSGQTALPDGEEAPVCSCACGGGQPPRCVNNLE
jgi:hypothetical protein